MAYVIVSKLLRFHDYYFFLVNIHYTVIYVKKINN